MSRVIVKKSYPEMFEKILSGEKTFDMRVADFDCEPGDILKQVEVSHDGVATGRVTYHEIGTPLRTKEIDWWDAAEIEQYGYVVMSLKLPSQSFRQIVDENDALIGHKWCEDMDYSRDIYRVSALWLRNGAGQALIAQRSPTNDNGAGLWGPAVAGVVEYDETYRDNIVKETWEEIGLSGLDIVDGPKIFISVNGRKYFCQFFYATIDKPATDFTLEDQVAAVRWVDEDELQRDALAHPEKYVDSFAREIGVLI